MSHRLTVFLALTIAPAAIAQTDIPTFVVKLINEYRSAAPHVNPDAVWEYRYQGATVYYVPALSCCDIPSELYDTRGKLLCHPDGGIAGIGDGKCFDFIKQRKSGRLLWKRSDT